MLAVAMPISQGSTINTDGFLQHPKISKDIDYLFPLPEPLTQTLISQNIPERIAERVSAVYIRRAVELKAHSTGTISELLSKLSPWGNAETFATLQNDLYETYKQKYLSLLAVWSQEACELASRHAVSHRSSSIVPLGSSTDDKKSRKKFKSEYLPLFEFAFSKDRFPSREDKKHLARISGMSYRQISVWFQNRRCRSGKHSRASILQTSGDETQTFGCTSPMVKRLFYHQDDIDKEDALTVDQPLDSADIIDLTFDYSHDDDVSYEKIMKSESSSNDDASSEVITDTLISNSRLPFPAPYVPSAPASDPFDVQLDSTLWPRRRGLKRPRTIERDLRISDISSNLESMDITSSISPNTRPVKSLPKRIRTGISFSPMSHPSPSLTYLSESTDEPPSSPSSHASSYSTVASSPDSIGICLPLPLLPNFSTFEDGKDKVEDQCLLERLECSVPETFLRISRGNKSGVDTLNHYDEASTIGLDLSLWGP